MTKSAGGIPSQFQLSEYGSVEWIDADELRRRWRTPELPTSGDVIQFDRVRTRTRLGRSEVQSLSNVTVLHHAGRALPDEGIFPTGNVFLVTARKAGRGKGKSTGCYWASALLSEETVGFSHEVEDRDAWHGFSAACRRSDDRRELENQKATSWRAQTAYAPVSWPPAQNGHTNPANLRGRRTRQSGLLFAGDVVWVRLQSRRIAAIRLAQVWRTPSHGARLKDRLKKAAPCPLRSEPGHLCLSCVTFGGVPADAKRGQGEQGSYQGHVRFSAAISGPAVDLENVHLTPMGTPNAGAGTFYLGLQDLDRSALKRNEIPSHWGVAEHEKAVNGRKLYWHSNPNAQAAFWSQENGRNCSPRYQHVGDATSMTRDAQLVPAGTVFTAKVGVDQLDQVGVDALLCALAPERILAITRHHRESEPQYAVHLGGGKPLGLGSATVTVEVNLTSSRDRYMVDSPKPTQWPTLSPQTDLERLLALEGRVGDFEVWLEALAVLLDLQALGELENYVSYPPGASWQEFGTKVFRNSYEFFQQTNGQKLKGGPRPWVVLPKVSHGADPSLPIYTKQGRLQ